MILRALDVPFDPAADFARLFEAHPYAFLLESAEGPERLARYSIVGANPAGLVRFRDGRLEVEGDAPEPLPDEAPGAYLRHVIRERPILDQGYRYLGGLVGYMGYEYVEQLERLPPRRNDRGFPDLEFGLYLDGLVFDHLTRKTIYFSHAEDRSRHFQDIMENPVPDVTCRFGEPRRNMSADQYHKMVEAVKHAIREGHTFQTVLSKRIDVEFEGNLLAFYQALKRANPSPYMYHLKMGERSIVGSSPEMLVRVDGGRVHTFPIAGTRPLGATPEETQRLAGDLLADPKEAAEHAMLVDLARNDVGRVAEFGTVRVPDYRKIERFSHVQHIVSSVEGRLQPGKDAFDALDAIFPAGTVSGAPKVRSMELIRELEPDARGPYAGAVGYFSFNGNADAAITIRTLVAHGNTASVQAGAGIVADSDPEKEWQETEAKARGLLAVMEDLK